LSAAEWQALLKGIAERDRRSLSRLISLVENADPGAEQCLSALDPRTGQAFRIGVTGPPGGGKSTLIDSLARKLRSEDLSIGVVAVDPSSPFTGGALLGDRVRLTSSGSDSGLFFRSMATRGSIGGLATMASEVSDVLDAYGMDVVFLETVGVGQIELDVVAASECTLVVLVPESGDDVQAMKAGLMEIGDVFVLNKSDRDSSGRAARELDLALQLRRHDASTWIPPIVRTVAREGRGIDELWEVVNRFREHQLSTGAGRDRRRKILHEKIREVTERILRRRIWTAGGEEELEAAVTASLDGRHNPYESAAELAERLAARNQKGERS
jgi:LAO/AO transport system kinase